jgi:hypothetical protein
MAGSPAGCGRDPPVRRTTIRLRGAHGDLRPLRLIASFWTPRPSPGHVAIAQAWLPVVIGAQRSGAGFTRLVDIEASVLT